MKSKQAEIQNLSAAKSIISTMHSIAEKRHGYYKMPVELRPVRNSLLEALSGLELVIVDGHYKVWRNGMAITEDESLADVEKIAENIN